jgi:hypothetical protein
MVDPPPDVCETALAMVLKDMGNGVTRLLSASFVCGALPPREFFDVFGASDLPFPLGAHVRDAVDCASAMHGHPTGKEFVGGYMRPLTEQITEFLIW